MPVKNNRLLVNAAKGRQNQSAAPKQFVKFQLPKHKNNIISPIMFVHHVFFWLRPDLSTADIQKFEKSVQSLLSIEHVQSGDVGQPSSTDRPVIERSYSYSLLLIFQDKAGHDQYQPHPVHQKFVADCSSLWTRVLIYDSETIANRQS